MSSTADFGGSPASALLQHILGTMHWDGRVVVLLVMSHQWHIFPRELKVLCKSSFCKILNPGPSFIHVRQTVKVTDHIAARNPQPGNMARQDFEATPPACKSLDAGCLYPAQYGGVGTEKTMVQKLWK